MDLFPGSVSGERMAVWYDASRSGSGQRILSLGSDGRLYAFEEGSNDLGGTIAMRVVTKELGTAGSDGTISIETVQLVADAGAGSVQIDRVYRSPNSRYRTLLDLTNAEAVAKGGYVTDDGKPHSVVSAPADGDGERALTGCLDVTMSAPSGSRLFRMIAKVVPAGVSGATGA